MRGLGGHGGPFPARSRTSPQSRWGRLSEENNLRAQFGLAMLTGKLNLSGKKIQFLGHGTLARSQNGGMRVPCKLAVDENLSSLGVGGMIYLFSHLLFSLVNLHAWFYREMLLIIRH